ncbi:MAG TPA: ribosome maturation factor RimM [Clostridia bacterium]|nr:ribosome maturation factor RimM [Clostridia bacterium]
MSGLSGSPEYITLAKVVKTQGRHGELAAQLFTDFPERFEDRRELSALGGRGERRELRLEDFWPHKGGMIFKFAGIDSIEDAEKLIGWEIQIPREQRAELEEGAVYVSDLVGCAVLVVESGGERRLGAIDDVNFGAGEAPLLVVKEGRKEYLIPFVEAFTKAVDVPGKRVVMQLPGGMLELDAPLSRDEQKRQEKPEDGDKV